MSGRVAPRSGDRAAWIRELVASVIALAITAVVLWLLIRTFSSSSSIDRRTDVLQLGLTLLGVILGYYFGRVPAERRADTADSRAAEALEQVGQIEIRLGERDRALADCKETTAKQQVELELRRNGTIAKKNND